MSWNVWPLGWGVMGCDFMLIVLSRVSGRDWRPYWDVRGVPYSSTAAAAVAALAAAGSLRHGNVTTRFFAVAGDDVPPGDLRVPSEALDGAASWPIGDGWAPVTTCVLGLRSPTRTSSGAPRTSPTATRTRGALAR